jgi:hypothetical protein
MHRVYPCGGVSRRCFLAAAPASVSFPSALSGSRALAQEAWEQASAEATHAGVKAKAKCALGAPGLNPGRVIEVKNPAMIRQGELCKAIVATRPKVPDPAQNGYGVIRIPAATTRARLLSFDHFCGSTKIRTLDISHWSPFLTRT